MLFRSRERLVHQRTELVNALRGHLYEFGHTIPQGIGHLKHLEAIIEAPHSDLPKLVREECHELLELIAEKTVRIEAKTRKIKVLAAETDTARRLQTMPGVGPLTALAVEAFAPEMAVFKRGRDFAAWLGLVPRQFSSGGKQRLGRVSKAGQADIRRLLIIGAMSRLNWMGRRSIPAGSWLARMQARKRHCCRSRLRDELPPFRETLGDALNLGLAEGVEAVHEGDADVNFGGLAVGVS